MKILHIEHEFDFPLPGGEQKRVFEECRRLAKTNEVLLAYSSFFRDWSGRRKSFVPERIPFKTIGFDIDEVYKPGKWNLGRTLLFPVRRKEAEPIEKIIKNFKPEIVHLHAGGGAALCSAIFATKSLKVPLVMMMHNHWPLCTSIGYFDFKTKTFCRNKVVCGRCLSDRFKSIVSFFYENRLARYVLKNVDHFICNTDFTKSLLIRAGIVPEKTTVIPPGIEPVTKRKERDYNHRKFITFSGRVSIEKGPDIFLEVAKSYANEDALQFLIIGDGPLRSEMEKLSKEYSIKNITFTGWINERDRYLDLLGQSKVLIVPSLWTETFGMVVLDAFQCGVPVIVSSRGGMPLFVKDGKNGFVVEPNAQEIIPKLETIIKNPSLWEEMSKACVGFDFKGFNWESNAEKLKNLYQQVIESYR